MVARSRSRAAPALPHRADAMACVTDPTVGEGRPRCGHVLAWEHRHLRRENPCPGGVVDQVRTGSEPASAIVAPGSRWARKSTLSTAAASPGDLRFAAVRAD